MAILGISQQGAGLTATTAADTIYFSLDTAVASSQTVLGLDGNDVIWLGAQGFTAIASATLVSGASGATGGSSTLSANLVGADVTYGTSSIVTGAFATTSVAVAGVVTSQIGARLITNSQFYGNAGNDSIYLAPMYSGGGTGVVGFTGISASTFGGGAGNDIIGTVAFVNNTAVTATAATGSFIHNSFFEGGGGNDTIVFLAESSTITGTTIGGNAGNDVISFRGINSANNFQVVLGGDADIFTGQASAVLSATIAGGGGNDTIIFSAGNVGSTLISLDTQNVASSFDGNDTAEFDFSGSISSTTVLAGAGNDTINWSASAYASANLIALNAGNDVLSAAGTAFSAATIQAGAGNDLLNLGTGALVSTITLGGGNDTLNYSGGYANSGLASAFSATTIAGGEGADQFGSANNDLGTGVIFGNVFQYDAISDSTISAMDTINWMSTGGQYSFRYSEGGLSVGSFSATGITGTNGTVAFTGTFATDVTSRAAALNSVVTTTGSVATFLDGNNVNYLFIKGSSSSYLISQVGTGGTATGGTLTIGGGGRAVTLGLGGQR